MKFLNKYPYDSFPRIPTIDFKLFVWNALGPTLQDSQVIVLDYKSYLESVWRFQSS